MNIAPISTINYKNTTKISFKSKKTKPVSQPNKTDSVEVSPEAKEKAKLMTQEVLKRADEIIKETEDFKNNYAHKKFEEASNIVKYITFEKEKENIPFSAKSYTIGDYTITKKLLKGITYIANHKENFSISVSHGGKDIEYMTGIENGEYDTSHFDEFFSFHDGKITQYMKNYNLDYDGENNITITTDKYISFDENEKIVSYVQDSKYFIDGNEKSNTYGEFITFNDGELQSYQKK